MKKYYLIDTFNGEGYTESGIIGSTEDHNKAIEMATDEFKDRYMTQLGEFTVNNQLHVEGSRYISYTEMHHNEDSGAIHVLATDDATVGILIHPDINEAVALTGDEFTTQFKFILNNIEDDEQGEEFLQEMLQVGNSGVHTNEGYIILYKL